MRRQAEARGVVRGQHVEDEKLERAKALRREMTPDERLLWRRLRRSQLPRLHFRRQQVIAGFIVDFYCATAGLVVEVDGAVHDTQPDYDAERDEILAARDIRILRIPNEDVQQDIDAVLTRIVSHATKSVDDDG